MKRSIPSMLGMIGGFSNIIWTGLNVLMLFAYLELSGGRSDLGLLASVSFSLLSALSLRYSARYDKDKKYSKFTLLCTVLLFLNALIFTPLIARNFSEVILFFLLLLGPGIVFLVSASYLQIKYSKK